MPSSEKVSTSDPGTTTWGKMFGPSRKPARMYPMIAGILTFFRMMEQIPATMSIRVV